MSKPSRSSSPAGPKLCQVVPIENARAKRLADAPRMFASVEEGRVQVSFTAPVIDFHLSKEQALYWARAFAHLANTLPDPEESA